MRRPLLLSTAFSLLLVGPARRAPAQLTGEVAAHDPSSVVKEGPTYYYFATGPGIVSRESTDRTAWSAGPSVFGAPPAWTTQAVPGFGGFFWAPDVIYLNGQYYLYYAVSTWGSKVSAIGVATSPTLNPAAPNYHWTDRGVVIQSGNATPYNAIDPSILRDSSGRVWMSYGSYNNGIYVTQLDPTTGKRLAGAPLVNVTSGGAIEGSALVQRGGYYYLVVNRDGCCAGVNSTYNIRVGRGTSPTGPFLDRDGVDMRSGGGSMFLDDNGNRIGPGHFAIYSEAGQDQFSYHYYDGNRNGAPTFGLNNLYWTADGWPSVSPVNPNWGGQISTNWSDAANWVRGAVPNGVGHVANFVSTGSGRYAVTVDGGGKTVSTMNFASPASYTIGGAAGSALTLQPAAGYQQATINVSDGSHTVSVPIRATGELGVNVTPAQSTLTLGSVTGTTLIKYGFGTLALSGANTYSGNVFAKWGALDVSGSVTAAQFSSVGQGVGENGTMTVRGTGAFTANADLNVGDTGDATTAATGTLNLRDGGRVTVNAGGGFFVGSGFSANTRAEGIVNQSGGTLTANGNFDNAFTIGGRASSLAAGAYNLSGGTVNANTNIRVGGAGTGTVNQTGGAFNANRDVSIGHLAGSTGRWTVSSGALNQNSPTGAIAVGAAGNGTLTVSGNGRVATSGTLRIGSSGTGVGTVNLDGGVLSAARVAGGTGTSTFNFNGGTLAAAASTTTFMQGLDQAYVRTGGARIDTGGKDVTVAQRLLDGGGGGGLTKVGAGTLTLTARNTYTGRTAITGGTLAFGASQRLGTLLLSSGTKATVAPTTPPAAGATLVMTSLLIPGAPGAWTARFDVAGGAAAVDYAARSASPLVTIADQVRSAAHRRAWDGQGITSSLADATAVGVGYAESAFALGPVGGSFGGEPVDGSAVLLRATRYGDADLNGTVNGADLAALRRNFGATGSQAVWQNGDFDYDGRIGPRDLVLLRRNFGTSMSWAATGAGNIAIVPEPTAMALIPPLAALALLRRRPDSRRPV
jgi:autotransporter-associated beta strand protein/T5SS/PEP-CTERM-associated repeat protein